MSKKNGLTLRITHPDGSVTESTSQLESVILGSGPGAAVKISDPKVSNLHVMLKVEKTGNKAKAREYYQKVMQSSAHNPTNAYARPIAKEKLKS